MRLERLSPANWFDFSVGAHRVVFGEEKDPSTDRIDYALLAVDAEKPVAYITCRELDSETIYWQFGGAFPGTRGTAVSFRAYLLFIAYAKAHYKRVATLIENTNLVMLKMAMKVGFRIMGVRLFKGQVLLEHLLEFQEAA